MLLIATLVIAALGIQATYFYFFHIPKLREAAVNAWRVRLTAVATDRGSALEAWVRERVGDAKLMAAQPAVTELLDTDARDRMSTFLDQFMRSYGYDTVEVLDARGAVTAQASQSKPFELCTQTIPQVATVDFCRTPTGQVGVVTIAPIRHANDATPIGAVVLVSDPAQWIYPFLRSEVVPTETAEVVLARREGDVATALTPLRHLQNAPLTLHRSAALTVFGIPGVSSGQRPFIAYRDYRNVPVFGATRVIAGTPWAMAAKVDQREAFASVWPDAMRIASFTFAITFLLALILAAMLRSHRVRHELALSESEEKYRRFVETATEGIWSIDEELRTTYVNQRMATLLGYTTSELIGEPLAKFLADDERAVFDEGTHERRFCRADGTIVHTIGSTVPITDANGRFRGAFGMFTDITKERVLEHRLAQSQKLEAVGTLAGGIAHDFNNILQGMMAMVQIAMKLLPSSERAHAYVLELEKLVRRGSGLTKQLLLFSRKETANAELLDLNEIIGEASDLLRRLVRENIAFAIDLHAKPLPVTVDRGQIEQVLVNLVVNAADAMPEGGQLRIASGALDGHHWVTVEDTGTGIPPAVRDRIFEPFFTTKGRNRGTGLGLSVVHGIVTEHSGSIDVDDRPGGGTVFRIKLPRVVVGGSMTVGSVDEDNPLPRGDGERVLVIEDEPSVREGLAAMLDVLQYDVVAVASGEEALRIAAETPFDLVLSDVVLPGIAGPKVIRELQEQWPELKVLLMSGYTDDDMLRWSVAAGSTHLLNKPFDLSKLACAMRTALEA